MPPDFFQRYSGRVLLVLACLIPIIAWGSLHVYQRKNNSVLEWLPQDFPATNAYNEFLEVFGSNESVLVSWEGCTPEDPRLEQLAAAIEAHDADDGTQWFSDVTTGPRVLRQIEKSADVAGDAAAGRLQGVLIGPDGETTCVLVTLEPLDDLTRQAVVAWIHETATEITGLPADEVRLTGDAVIGVAIDTENERAINTWITLAMLLALVLAWQSLRSLKLGLIVFMLGGFSSTLCEALIYYTGGTMNMLLTLVPVLMFVLAISGSVHLSNYYRDALDEHGDPATAPGEAFARGWKPCLFASLTSALGLGSLCVSHVAPVWSFGFYAALTIMVLLAVLLFWLPAALTWFPLQPRSAEQKQRVSGWQTAYVERLVRLRVAVVTTAVAALLLLGAGLFVLQTEVKPSRFLSPRSKWIQDTNWFTERLGPFQSVEVLLSFDEAKLPDLQARLAAVQHADQALSQVNQVRGTLSAVTFLPATVFEPADRGGLLPLVRRRFVEQQFRKNRDSLLEAGVLARRDGRELWRISIRVEDFNTANYKSFLGNVQQAAAGNGDLEVELTGAIPLLFSSQEELLTGLAESFLLAFAMIAVVLSGLLRSLRAGLLCMLPNVFPAVVIFGLMGWLGRPVDVGSMMTASVALGIAVDDTIHFLTWFRRYVERGLSQHDAVRQAFAHCAAPILQTSLIVAGSFGVFFFSTFRPVSQFGLLMATLLVAAVIGDLVLLPALLATRVGKWFVPARENSVENPPQSVVSPSE